ncbi:EAL domain-containing protein [Romboutsia weinsteinii]|uniref:EAL domain-containing protein n=1 Tax=Romboutsia weinsteinii TaxID=2020949 RepID=A0A371J7C2_9FIRM|nr:EAL domain-containing protein [Romboutsia weinsteinii]RDY28567.1 EAL domain-containing protein [Romboutsia weinsteinii]
MTSKHVFKYKLVVQATVIVFILSLIGAIFFIEIKGTLSQQTMQNITQITSYISENIDKSIENSLGEIEILSNYISVYNNRNKEKIHSIIEKQLDNKNSLVKNIHFVNKQGQVLSKNSTNNVSNEEYFKNAILGKTYVSKPVKSDVDGLHYITYSKPLYQEENIIGMVFGSNTIEDITNKINLEIYSDRGNLVIIDNEGNVILSYDEDIMNKNLLKVTSSGDPSNKRIKDDIKRYADHGLEKIYIDNEYRYVGYSRIKTSKGWYVVTSIPAKDFLYNANNIDKIIKISIILVISIGVIIHLYISRIKKINQRKLEKLAFEDHLTGINNYKRFLIEAKDFIIRSNISKYAIISFDIDRFKIINDVHGYHTGDEILKAIADNIRNHMGENTVYGKFSNDLFGIMLCLDNDEKDILRIVKLINNEIANVEFEDKKINIKASIGIYFIEDENIDIKRFIDNANLARTKAKIIQNQNYYVFDTELKQCHHSLIKIEQDIATGIKNNEFSVYYQAKFNIDGSKIVGAEALIRWNHTDMGMISPCKFIPIAEKSGDINLIGRWVFEHVCKKLSEWKHNSYDLVPISINLSRVELYQPDLRQFLQNTVEKYGVDSKLIEIEITETTALNDVDFINRKIKDIKSLGIAISMDDFGTGNSTLSNLKLVDIDILKIDRTLVSDIENDLKSKEMVATIIELSKKLGLEVVCEGVENLEQVQILKHTKCDIIQGFVFARPVDSLEFEHMIKNK